MLTNFFKKMFDHKLFQKKFDQKRKPLRKGLTENGVTFGFESLIPKPYQRDQPAQRLVINRRNG
ncbi:MAG: hypothetical protein GX152_01340 [Methanosarcina sp.]|nr:hypothetical protein [Methanosarcina sp.]